MKFYYDLPTSRLMRQIRGGTITELSDDGRMYTISGYSDKTREPWEMYLNKNARFNIGTIQTLDPNSLKEAIQTIRASDIEITDPELLDEAVQDIRRKNVSSNINNQTTLNLLDRLKRSRNIKQQIKQLGKRHSNIMKSKREKRETREKIDSIILELKRQEQKEKEIAESKLRSAKVKELKAQERRYARERQIDEAREQRKKMLELAKERTRRQELEEEKKQEAKQVSDYFKKAIEQAKRDEEYNIATRAMHEMEYNRRQQEEMEESRARQLRGKERETAEAQEKNMLDNLIIDAINAKNLYDQSTTIEQSNSRVRSYRSSLKSYINGLLQSSFFNAPQRINELLDMLNDTYVKENYMYGIVDKQLVPIIDVKGGDEGITEMQRRAIEDKAIGKEIELGIKEARRILSTYWKETSNQTLEVMDGDTYINDLLGSINLVEITDDNKKITVSEFIKEEKERYTDNNYSSSSKLLEKISSVISADKVVEWGKNFVDDNGRKYFYYDDNNVQIFDFRNGDRIVSNDSLQSKYSNIKYYLRDELFIKSGKGLEHIVCADPEISKLIFGITFNDKSKESISVSDHLIDSIFRKYVNSIDKFKNVSSASGQFPHDVISIDNQLAIEMKDYKDSLNFKSAYNINIRLKIHYFNKLKKELNDLIEAEDIGYNALNEKLTEAKKLNEKLEIKRLNKQIKEVKKEIKRIVDIMTNKNMFDRAFYVNNKYIGFGMTINKFTKPTQEKLNADIEMYKDRLPMNEEYIRRIYSRQGQLYTPVMLNDGSHKITSYKMNKGMTEDNRNEITKIIDDRLNISQDRPYDFISLITLGGAVTTYDYTNDPLFSDIDTDTILMFFKGATTQNGWNGVSIPVDRLRMVFQQLPPEQEQDEDVNEDEYEEDSDDAGYKTE